MAALASKKERGCTSKPDKMDVPNDGYCSVSIFTTLSFPAMSVASRSILEETTPGDGPTQGETEGSNSRHKREQRTRVVSERAVVVGSPRSCIAKNTRTLREPHKRGQEDSNVQWRHQLAGSAPLGVHVHQNRDVLHNTKHKPGRPISPSEETSSHGNDAGEHGSSKISLKTCAGTSAGDQWITKPPHPAGGCTGWADERHFCRTAATRKAWRHWVKETGDMVDHVPGPIHRHSPAQVCARAPSSRH